jgi:N utilization substance protein A
MVSELSRAIDQIVKDKGIPRETLIEASEKSILAAARKMFGPNTDIEAQYNEELGEVELFEFKTVVEELDDAEVEISLEEARELDPGAEPGDSLGIKMDLGGFGRIAAQTAKQVLLQHVRDAEREYIYNEYKDRKDELITGIVRRFEKGALIVDLGKAEAVLPPREQVPTESYRPGDRIQAYVLDVLRTARGPQIILSRTHPGLIRKLFEMEVPEIFEGVVRIEAVAREPGHRAKIAVASRDSDVDPVGACVGMKGSRVQAVVQELRGEKIDIIPWSIDPAKFICNAIAPAAVTKVIIDEETRSMELIVPDDQLSLAIGRRGQNVRLAAQLTGWRIDIISETKIQEMNARAREELKLIEGLSETLVEILVRHGYRAINDVADAEPEELVEFLGIDPERADRIIKGAQGLLAERKAEAARARALAAAGAAEAASLVMAPPVEAAGSEPQAG